MAAQRGREGSIPSDGQWLVLQETRRPRTERAARLRRPLGGGPRDAGVDRACVRSAGKANRRDHWAQLHTNATRAAGPDAQLRAYLDAARQLARQHPHPGNSGGSDSPPLAQVYVRQHRTLTTGSSDEPVGTPQLRGEPAEDLFQSTERVSVLIAGPGGGKSTLLRTRLATAADHWLGGEQRAVGTGAAIPIRIDARDLAGETTLLPDALAEATARLSRYGRDPHLDRARFLQRPWPGACWQLLVDGLDELPDTRQRREVLQKLAHAAAGEPALYRCLVTTRPLDHDELAVLDRILDRPAPRYVLQPFTDEDVHAYLAGYFAATWPQVEARRRTREFVAALDESLLSELARTPLMAFMLAQLYLADPQRPLPGGRSGLYRAFSDLVYAQNPDKPVWNSHKRAIKNLVQGFHDPQTRKEVEQAAHRPTTGWSNSLTTSPTSGSLIAAPRPTRRWSLMKPPDRPAGCVRNAGRRSWKTCCGTPAYSSTAQTASASRTRPSWNITPPATPPATSRPARA